MKTITTLTRMWLTRSTKPFIFQNEYDQKLPYSDCQNLGLYVHIPFSEAFAISALIAKLCIQQNYVTGISILCSMKFILSEVNISEEKRLPAYTLVAAHRLLQ